MLLQGLPQRWRFIQTFPLWQFVKFIYTGFILNYSASAFLVRVMPAVRNARAKQASNPGFVKKKNPEVCCIVCHVLSYACTGRLAHPMDIRSMHLWGLTVMSLSSLSWRLQW